MAFKIRLARGGTKKRPFYKIVVAEATSPRDGRFVERVGSYNPMLPQGHADRVVLVTERAQHWLSVGALPTDRVARFLANANLIAAIPQTETPIRSAPKKKAQERLKAAADAIAKAEAAAKAAAEAAEEAKKKAAEEAAAAAAAPAEPAPEAEAAAEPAAAEETAEAATEEKANESAA
jgi:small subunit ribosomal protein S16